MPTSPGLQQIEEKDLQLLCQKPPSHHMAQALHSLWIYGYSLDVSSKPSWSGFMQLASRDVIPDVSRIEILPFINMNPSDTTTIYSALCFAQEQCRKQGIPLCPVTFDQPLKL